MEIGEISGFGGPDTHRGSNDGLAQVTPSASVFGQDLTDTHSKSRPKAEEEDEEHANVFQKYEKNETFPIHANFDDS